MVNIFSSLGVKFEGHIGFKKLQNFYVVKALMAHTFFVEFHVFKPALHKKVFNTSFSNTLGQLQFSCYDLSMFRTVFL